MKTIAPSILKVVWIQQPQQGDRQKKQRQQETSPNNPIKLRINVEKDQFDRNEEQPFDSTPSDEDTTEREESILRMHRSNQNTGLCNSQVDHDDRPRSVSQHSNNVRSPFDTPERRKRASEHADSSRSEQKYSQETGHIKRHIGHCHSSEDDTSNKTNESQHSEIEETLETHQHSTPNEESKPEDIQRRIKIRCDEVQSKILFM